MSRWAADVYSKEVSPLFVAELCDRQSGISMHSYVQGEVGRWIEYVVEN